MRPCEYAYGLHLVPLCIYDMCLSTWGPLTIEVGHLVQHHDFSFVVVDDDEKKSYGGMCWTS